MLGDFNRVNVMPVDGRCNGKCSIKGCNNNVNYFLFVDDGMPKLSRSFSQSCIVHLKLSIKKANDYNKSKKNKNGKKRIY